MKRKDFLKGALALCGLALVPVAVIESCSKQNLSGPTNVNFTLDITTAANSALKTAGGSLVANGVLLIRASTTSFNALSATCTHAGCTVGYDAGAAKVSCPCHGGTFNPATGAVLGGPPPSPLTKYTAVLSGNILTVTS